jgi:hypothetical protein
MRAYEKDGHDGCSQQVKVNTYVVGAAKKSL